MKKHFIPFILCNVSCYFLADIIMYTYYMDITILTFIKNKNICTDFKTMSNNLIKIAFEFPWTTSNVSNNNVNNNKTQTNKQQNESLRYCC